MKGIILAVEWFASGRVQTMEKITRDLCEADDNKLIEAILTSGVKIPAMPAILHEVQTPERNDDAGPREYAALVSRDLALAGA